MAFQKQVLINKSSAVIGDVFTDEPIRAESFILNSTSPNVIGYLYTVSAQGVATVGGTGIIAGILVNSKQYSLYGDATGTLAPSLTLPNNAQATLVKMGTVVVNLPAAAAIGDEIQYNTTTGALISVAPGTAPATGYAVCNAVVSRYTVTAAGPAVITITN